MVSKKVLLALHEEQLGYAWCAELVGSLRIEVDRGRDLLRIGMYHENETVSLVFDSLDGLSASVRTTVPDRAEAEERKDQFAAQWLPVFRRGCWLSGCPIEASGHEKAE